MNIFYRFFCIIQADCIHMQAAFCGASSLKQKFKSFLRSIHFSAKSHFSPNFLSPVRRQGCNRAGFTLLEVMMVIAIIGTLAAIAIPNYIGYREKAHFTATIQTMRMIEKELLQFNLEKGRFPDTLAEAGLDHLRDPWGNPFQYLNISTTTKPGKIRKNYSLHPLNTDYDLYSMGPDGKSVPPLTGKSSRDDILRASNGAFLGKGSDY